MRSRDIAAQGMAERRIAALVEEQVGWVMLIEVKVAVRLEVGFVMSGYWK